MALMSSVALIFIVFAALLLLDVPISISIGLSCVAYCVFFEKIQFSYLVTTLFTSIDSFPLMAIPFFILSGGLMEGGGLSRRLCGVADAFVGHLPGGFAVVTVITCMFFGAISGSAPATVAAIGVIMVPAMIEHGYDKPFSYALIAASGILGVQIPPSIPFVMFGVATNVSIAQMFLAGFDSGILTGTLLIIMCLLIAKKKGWSGNGLKFSWRRVGRSIRDAIWALFVPIVILGGIYGGIFTPTEAASVAVVYALIAGTVIYKELTFKKFVDSLSGTMVTTATILLIVATATTLARIFTLERIPTTIANFFYSSTDNVYVLLLMMNLFLLFVGCVMDTIAAIMVLAPIMLPIAQTYGVDPVHFGIIMCLNLAIGLITPPVGVNLYVASGLGKISFVDIVKAIWPMLITLLISLTIVTLWPGLVLFIPRLFGYGG